MKVCFPVVDDEGFDSRITGHFGSAPLFLLIDTDTGEASSIANCDRQNPDAGCNPIMALGNRQLEGAVVAGIGDGMLEMLNLAGMVVYQAQSESVRENVELLRDNALEALAMMNSAEEGKCGGKDESHACTQDHDVCTHDHEGCENAR